MFGFLRKFHFWFEEDCHGEIETFSSSMYLASSSVHSISPGFSLRMPISGPRVTTSEPSPWGLRRGSHCRPTTWWRASKNWKLRGIDSCCNRRSLNWTLRLLTKELPNMFRLISFRLLRRLLGDLKSCCDIVLLTQAIIPPRSCRRYPRFWQGFSLDQSRTSYHRMFCLKGNTGASIIPPPVQVMRNELFGILCRRGAARMAIINQYHSFLRIFLWENDNNNGDTDSEFRFVLVFVKSCLSRISSRRPHLKVSPKYLIQSLGWWRTIEIVDLLMQSSISR
jgi:hypothetical protein